MGSYENIFGFEKVAMEFHWVFGTRESDKRHTTSMSKSQISEDQNCGVFSLYQATNEPAFF